MRCAAAEKQGTRLSALRTASRQYTMLLLLPLALGSITATVGSDRTPTPEQLLYQQREVSGQWLADRCACPPVRCH